MTPCIRIDAFRWYVQTGLSRMLPYSSLIEERKGARLRGRYLIKEVLAEGGMSFLFAGTDTQNNLPIAIKYLRSHNVGKANQRFANEIRTVRRLQHPNIVTVIDSGYDEHGTPYLIMELLEGKSLGAELASLGEIAVEQALEWLLPIMSAMCYAHDNGIVDRDLKPANIFLAQTDGGDVSPKFGISLFSDAARITRSGTVVGSVQYMSPEQAKDEPIGPASDTWAMGVVLFNCLTGRLPFEGDTAAGVLYKIVNGRAPKLMSIRKGIGPMFCAAVDCALAKDLSRRYRDMRSFALTL